MKRSGSVTLALPLPLTLALDLVGTRKQWEQTEATVDLLLQSYTKHSCELCIWEIVILLSSTMWLFRFVSFVVSVGVGLDCTRTVTTSRIEFFYLWWLVERKPMLGCGVYTLLLINSSICSDFCILQVKKLLYHRHINSTHVPARNLTSNSSTRTYANICLLWSYVKIHTSYLL